MLSLLLLTLVIFWMVRDYLQDSIAGKQEKDQLARRTELRRSVLARNPGSPAAHETLGDALRAEGDLPAAIAAYEEALSLAKYIPAGAADGGWLSGAGLENKLRLTRSEMAQKQDPEKFGMTMRTRQQVCRVCTYLGQPTDRDCRNCGAPLPVDGFFDTLRHEGIRHSLLGEAIQAGVMLTVICVALLIASWMPIEIRGAIAIAALIVIPMRLLKKFGGD
jgi:tetratricopeptide (TPR) repeat protein